MKGLKLIFLGLVVSVLFMGQAIAGVANMQWVWSATLSADPTAVNLAPNNTAPVNFLLDNIMATQTQTSCSNGDCNDMVGVIDSLSGDNVTGLTLMATAGSWSSISWQSTIGPFSSPGMMTISNMATFVNSDGFSAGTSNQVMIPVTVSEVPEPSTMVLLGGGLLSLVFFRRKFRK